MKPHMISMIPLLPKVFLLCDVVPAAPSDGVEHATPVPMATESARTTRCNLGNVVTVPTGYKNMFDICRRGLARFVDVGVAHHVQLVFGLAFG